MNASTPGSIAWFAAHELRLAWREALAMLTGGKSSVAQSPWAPGSVAFMHLVAISRCGSRGAGVLVADACRRDGRLLLSGSALLSQAMRV
jgi:ABC-2 type transport system permease protein